WSSEVCSSDRMGVVARTADDVMVMYAGKPVEHAPAHELFHDTRMPYSIGLLGAIPRVDKKDKEPLIPIKGNPPLLIDLPDACPFADSCPLAISACRDREPDFVDVATASGVPHQAACIRAHEIDENGMIDGQPVYPIEPIPESELTSTPREQREVTLEVRNMVKTFPLLKG